MEPITLVWNRNDSWEEEWIEYLFQHVPHKTIYNLDHTRFIDRSVIIDSLPWAPYHNGYMAEMQRRGLSYGLIHLSDESRSDDISSYGGCKFVLRNYVRDHVPTHCRHFLLGYNTGFTKHTHNPEAYQRKYTWATIVHRWDSNRSDMARHLASIPNGFFYIVNHHGPRMTVEDYSYSYRDAVFVICPNGAVIPDSFRITEAMEAGAIPIVQASDYWVRPYGNDFPAVVINGWHELSSVIANFTQDPVRIVTKRQQCIDWWAARKKENVDMVTDLVMQTMF
jgi:hypothetical protein